MSGPAGRRQPLMMRAEMDGTAKSVRGMPPICEKHLFPGEHPQQVVVSDHRSCRGEAGGDEVSNAKYAEATGLQGERVDYSPVHTKRVADSVKDHEEDVQTKVPSHHLQLESSSLSCPFDVASTTTTSAAGSPPQGVEYERLSLSALGPLGGHLSSVLSENRSAGPATLRRSSATKNVQTPSGRGSQSEQVLSLSHSFKKAATNVVGSSSFGKMLFRPHGGSGGATHLRGVRSEEMATNACSLKSQSSYGCDAPGRAVLDAGEDTVPPSLSSCSGPTSVPGCPPVRCASPNTTTRFQQQLKSSSPPQGRFSHEEGPRASPQCSPFSANASSSGISWTNTTVASDARQWSDAYAASECNVTSQLTDEGRLILAGVAGVRSTASAPATPPALHKRVPAFGFVEKKVHKNADRLKNQSPQSATSRSPREVGTPSSPVACQSAAITVSSSQPRRGVYLLKRMKTEPAQERQRREQQEDSTLTHSQEGSGSRPKLTWGFSLRGGFVSRKPQKFFRNFFKAQRQGRGGFFRSKSAPGLGRASREEDEDDGLVGEEDDDEPSSTGQAWAGGRGGGGFDDKRSSLNDQGEKQISPGTGEEPRDEAASNTKMQGTLSYAGGGKARSFPGQPPAPFSSEPPGIASAPATVEGGKKKTILFRTRGASGSSSSRQGLGNISAEEGEAGGTNEVVIVEEEQENIRENEGTRSGAFKAGSAGDQEGEGTKAVPVLSASLPSGQDAPRKGQGVNSDQKEQTPLSRYVPSFHDLTPRNANHSPPSPPPPPPGLLHMAQTDTNIEWRSTRSSVGESSLPLHRDVVSAEHRSFTPQQTLLHQAANGELLSCGSPMKQGRSFCLQSLQGVSTVTEDGEGSPDGHPTAPGVDGGERTEAPFCLKTSVRKTAARPGREVDDREDKGLVSSGGATRENTQELAVPSGDVIQSELSKPLTEQRPLNKSTSCSKGGVVQSASSRKEGVVIKRGKPEKFSRQTMHRLVMKQFRVTNLTAADMRLVIRYKSLYLDDVKGLLEIARLPAYAGHVHTAPTTDKNSWLNRPRWSARYFVLRYGHWFWFRDEKALLTGGLSACLGSLSLLLNPFTIDLHPKYTTRFFVRFGDWYSVQIDTSIERKDRGEWALLFLASGNLGEQIRMCFTDIDWTQVQTRSRLVARQNFLVP